MKGMTAMSVNEERKVVIRVTQFCADDKGMDGRGSPEEKTVELQKPKELSQLFCT